jgi:hypothetical protein
LNCFGIKARPTKRSLALAVIITLNECFPLSPLFPRAVKDCLPRLGEVRPVVHALLQVVPAATCSSLARDYQEHKLREH